MGVSKGPTAMRLLGLGNGWRGFEQSMKQSTKDAVFIQANPQQMLGAKVAAHALKRNSREPESFNVFIMHTEDHPFLAAREGQEYRWGSRSRVWRMADLQSFTPLRFMPPELMGYSGRAIVIDPDCFALGDVRDLFDMDMQGKAIWCAKRGSAKHNNRKWASSVMLLDCAKLKHWRVREQFDEMFTFERDYVSWNNLEEEPADTIGELPRIWNDFDRLTPETKILHNTRRRTQPWKTGLPVDFTVRERGSGIFGTKWLAGSRSMALPISAVGTYKPHPDPAQERLFFSLLGECIKLGSVTLDEINEAMALNYVRHDALSLVANPNRAVRAVSAPFVAAGGEVRAPALRPRSANDLYIGAVVASATTAVLAILVDPQSVQSWAINNGPLDQISAVFCMLSVVLAFGTLIMRGAKWLQWPVHVALIFGLMGFLNAKNSLAGPLPVEFSELLGALFEPDNLSGQSWSAIIMTSLVLLFLVYALTQNRNEDSRSSGSKVLLSALIVAVLSPLVGDLIGDLSAPARVMVEVLELCSSAGFLLAASVSIWSYREALSRAPRGKEV
jgi:hypothetical protein